MPFYDNNLELKNQFDALPEKIKNHIDKNDKKISSSQELGELVRRIETIEQKTAY